MPPQHDFVDDTQTLRNLTSDRVTGLAAETARIGRQLGEARAAHRAAVTEFVAEHGYAAAAAATGLSTVTIRGLVMAHRRQVVEAWASSVDWTVLRHGRISTHRGGGTVSIAGVLVRDEHDEPLVVDLLLVADVVERCVVWDRQPAVAVTSGIHGRNSPRQ